MSILTIGDILCLIVGAVGIILAIYFYEKSKKHKETIAIENRAQLNKIEGTVTENQSQLNNIVVPLKEYRVQEKTADYPDIKKAQNMRKAFEAFLAFILILVLIKVISDYVSERGKR
jgi:uncharacterized protein YpmS